MSQGQTARGPVETASLGRVLMHEHVFVLTAEVQQNWPEEWGDEDARVADAVRRLPCRLTCCCAGCPLWAFGVGFADGLAGCFPLVL